MAKSTYSVLLVDDSHDDRLFIRKAIHKNQRLIIVGELEDGETAIAYLDGKIPFHDRGRHPFPDLVLLDLKMPRKTGHEVLEWLRTKTFAGLYVVVFSGSSLPEDIKRSKELGAHAYYKKNTLRKDREAMIAEITQRLDTL